VIEAFYFFIWIFASILFLAFAFLKKFKSISKNELLLSMDSNCWNDKDTDDFLRYLKQEYFMFTFTVSFLIMELTLSNMEVLGEGIGNKGASSVRLCFIILVSSRMMCFTYLIFLMTSGKKIGDD